MVTRIYAPVTVIMSRSRKAKSDADIIALKTLMIRRGLDYRQLAELCKMPPRRVANVLCLSDRTRPIREAINAALGETIFFLPTRPAKPKRGRKTTFVQPAT
jgi:hypothetical protein